MPSTVRARQGETPDMLAFRLWGNELLATRLLAANPAYIGVVLFAGGEVLAVPEVETATATEEATPPWLA